MKYLYVFILTEKLLITWLQTDKKEKNNIIVRFCIEWNKQK
jgi:hypothetical protein